MGAVWTRLLPNYQQIIAQAPRIELQGFEIDFVGGGDIEAVASSASRVSVRDLGDLKLYDIAEPTTLAARQMKQIRFLDSRDVPFQRIYRVDAAEEINYVNEELRPARLMLRLTNDKASRLGKPLPAGKVAVTEILAGTPVLLGQPEIGDTPIDLPMELRGDEIVSVSAQLRAIPVTPPRPDDKVRRRSYEVTISNSKPMPITFEWALQYFYDDYGGQQHVVTESSPHVQRNGDMVWVLRLKPNSQMVLRYTIDWPR
jgi:hypothetical protein